MYDRLREEITNLCVLCYSRGHVAAANGNISARTDDNRGIIIKASGVSFANINKSDLLFVDWHGGVFDCDTMLNTNRRPSMELQLHSELYPLNDMTGAVVHLHSPYTTALSCCLDEIPLIALEARHSLGHIPIIPAYAAGSTELSAAVRRVFAGAKTSVAVLREHGSVAIGKDLQDAYKSADMLEHNSHIATITRLLSLTNLP